MRQHATNHVVGVDWMLVCGSVPRLGLDFALFVSLSTDLKVQTYTYITDVSSRMLLGPRLLTSCSPMNGVRRPRQIRGPKIRANVPPKGRC